MLYKVKVSHLDQLKLWHEQVPPCKWSRLCILMTGWLEWCSAAHLVQSLDCRIINAILSRNLIVDFLGKWRKLCHFFWNLWPNVLASIFLVFQFSIGLQGKGGIQSIWGPQTILENHSSFQVHPKFFSSSSNFSFKIYFFGV